MDYIKEYRSFVNSRYLGEGIRVTAGILLPAVILNYFGLLIVGVVVSLGALCVSVTDSPGPIQHRRNGMLICTVFIFIVALCTGLASGNRILTAMLIAVFCFVFSMIAVYGNRAISVGLAALLVMVLNIDRPYRGQELIYHALYILAGGVWYTALSMISYRVRPYKLAQQSLGDCIIATAGYLRIRAGFYEKNTDFEKVYRQLFDQQVAVHQKQELVRELLFKSRDIVKETTLTGRTLLLMFTDVVDLFEQIITSYQDYASLHRYFDGTAILEQFRKLILKAADDLQEIGIAVTGRRAARQDDSLTMLLAQTREQLDKLRDEQRNAANLEGFISLRNILHGLEDIVHRLNTLRLHTAYDKKLVKENGARDYERFISRQDYSAKVLLDNLTLKSNIFRHAIRVSIATLAGYFVSNLLAFGHSYWLLLTIIVILKPAYSLTRKRNLDRLLGTIGGATIGIIILLLVKDDRALFVIMMFLMVGTYSFLRTRYLLAVMLMTPYILLLFHLIYKANFRTIVWDRILDTVIGSAIAYLANGLVLPVWERDKMTDYMADMLDKCTQYFTATAVAFYGEPPSKTDYKVSRKEAFVALANLSEAFSRMLSEPKNRQRHVKEMYEFVALNHTLVSHIAALSFYASTLAQQYRSPEFAEIIRSISNELAEARAIVAGQGSGVPLEHHWSSVLEERLNDLMKRRHEEIGSNRHDTDTRKQYAELKSIMDQFRFIDRVSSDIRKTVERISSAA